MLRRALAALLTLTMLPPLAESADLAHTVARGAKLRAHLDGRTVEGAFERQSGSTLLVRADAEEVAIDTQSIERLELARERRGRTLEGFAIGVGAGAIAGGIIAESEGFTTRREARTLSIIAGCLLIGAAGGFLGVLIGSRIETDRWVDLPPETYAAAGTDELPSPMLRVEWSVRW